ncbi:SRPBCC family protein [Tamlana crocina]
MAHEKITIEATIDRPIESVWAYYNQPEHIVNWNFASEDWHCPKAEIDLKVNGKMKSRMEAKDGSFGFDFEATYNIISEFKKIVYTIEDGRTVNIDFKDENGKTKVSVVFEAENMNPVDMQRDGWQAILNNFKAYAESK